MNEYSLNTLLADSRIRREFYEGEWYYSVIDIVAIIFDFSLKDAKNHYFTLKKRLRKEMGDVSFKYKQLRLTSRDNKKYLTDVANIAQVMRLIQSISSPKIEPIKLWLVEVAKKHLENNP